MTSSAIAVSGLRKAYGDKVVLDGIDFDVVVGFGDGQPLQLPCTAQVRPSRPGAPGPEPGRA